uniref:Tr-type G domain-containing protein n=1 Tax=Photinus pyralis TaxID=7054 RepID=A0A1Y1MZ57_PHOPY
MNISKRMKQLMCISKRSRNFCSSNQWNNDINKIRNIGILAHIDAGKTTTTERMLYYSGKIHHMGEVHHGNTVTDYMTQERERGITIKSAAVTFKWKGHQFNLIDTPGHIDFTMEVEETLSVLDSAIVILDASAGVEAQTVTVWRQADRYKIPRLVYINKMDRADANLESCCTSIEKKFGSPTLCLQLPLMENGKFVGLIDILTLEKLVPSKEKLTRTLLIEQEDLRNWTAAKNARSVLVDRLTDLDDNFANLVISADSIDHIQTTEISKTLWKITAKQDATPVLCGSSYKNIGVEPLMDAVILYLTSPKDGNNIYSCFKNSLCARAFKIIHDKQRGPLVFLRIYCGEFKQGQKIYNITKDCTEHSGRLYIAYADEFQEIGSMQNGNIAVVSGLKVSITYCARNDTNY